MTSWLDARKVRTSASPRCPLLPVISTLIGYRSSRISVEISMLGGMVLNRPVSASCESRLSGRLHENKMQRNHNEHEITDDRSNLDFALIHSWLTESYWSPGITRLKVEQAARHSAVVVSVYGSRTVGTRQVVIPLSGE